MNDHEFDALAIAAADSYVGRAVRLGAGYLAAAWTSARVVSSTGAIARQLRALSPTDRTRMAATCAGTAAITYWALLRVTPPYVATGIPHAWFLGVGLLALGATLLAGPLARGWPDSEVRRLIDWVIR